MERDTHRERDRALEHFEAKLAHETDAYDLHEALEADRDEVVVVDARSPEAYARGHLPGALNIPHRRMDGETTAGLPEDRTIVVYCDGIGCNASTKGAANLTRLGFRAKELIGGLEWWKRDGYPVAVGGVEERA